MSTRHGGRFWMAAGCVLLVAGVGIAREAVPELHHNLPADAVLEGPLVVHGENVAELILAGSAVEVIEGMPGRYVPVQWTGPRPEGFAVDLRARVRAGQSGPFFGAHIVVALDLTAVPERPLILRGHVVDDYPTNGPRRTEFYVVSPRVIAPDGRVREHQDARTQSSVTISAGVTTRSFRFGHTFGTENPVRLEVVADDVEGCGPSETDSATADHGATLANCLGGATLPVEIHAVLETSERGLFEERPPPTTTCTLSLVQYGFDRPAR